MIMDLTEQEAEEIDQFLNSKAFITPVVSAQNLCSINSCPDKQMYRARIQYLFQVDAYVQNENGEINDEAKDIMIDLIHDAILFTNDNQFSYAKSILFLTIYIAVLQQVILKPFWEPNRVYKQYEKCILMHSVERPPFSVAIFNLADIKVIHEYFMYSFFRNLKFLMNCFTKEPRLCFTYKEPGYIKVPTLPPLMDMDGEIKTQLRLDQRLLEQSTPIAKGTSSAKSSTPTVSRSMPDEIRQQTPKEKEKEKEREKEKEKEREKEKELQQQLLQQQREHEQHQHEPEDRGPNVPIEMLKDTLSSLHVKFVHDFDEKERLLVGKIKELEIKIADKQAAAQAAAAKKLNPKSPKR